MNNPTKEIPERITHEQLKQEIQTRVKELVKLLDGYYNRLDTDTEEAHDEIQRLNAILNRSAFISAEHIGLVKYVVDMSIRINDCFKANPV